MTDRSDDFDRPNETPLAGNWTIGVGDAGSWNLVSNAVAPSALGSDASAYYRDSWQPDQSSSVPVTVASTAAGTGPGICLRRSATIRTYYRAVVSKAATNNINLGRYLNGTFTSLVSFTTTWVDGDVLLGTIAGPRYAARIALYQNNVLIGTFTDNSLIETGAPGVAYSSTATSASLASWVGSDSGLILPRRMPLGV